MAKEPAPAHFPSPFDHPLGDDHHCNVPLSDDDIALGSHLAWSMGTLYSDVEESESAAGHFHYRVSTSSDQWSRIARALRIHGLCICDMPARGMETVGGDAVAAPGEA